jgi:hypothetical protein
MDITLKTPGIGEFICYQDESYEVIAITVNISDSGIEILTNLAKVDIEGNWTEDPEIVLNLDIVDHSVI